MDNRKRRSTEYNRISSASSKNGPFPIAFLPNNFLLEFLEHSTWRASITRDHPCTSLCTFPKSSSFPSNRHASHSNVEWRGETGRIVRLVFSIISSNRSRLCSLKTFRPYHSYIWEKDRTRTMGKISWDKEFHTRLVFRRYKVFG